MSKMDYDIGVIGGGSAGLTVAAGASRLGAKTLLVEKEPALGGDCLHYGCVPSKALIESARAFFQMKNAHRFGLVPAPVGPADFAVVSAHIRAVIERVQEHDSVERFTSLGCDVRFGASRFADEHTVEMEGVRVSAKKWVIATGSSPAVPPIPGLDQVFYLTNKEIFFLDTLPCSLLVLGGGPIGVEMAQAFARLGSRVMVVEKAPQILDKEDPDLAGELQGVLEREGVVFHLGCEVLSATRKGGQKQLVVQKADGGQTTLSADQLLVAVGRRANTAGLGLSGIGVEADAGGVKVDARMRTSHGHIFAAGDASGPPFFTHAAGYEGGIVVQNAVLHLPRKVDYTNLCWCTYTDPELASIGVNEKEAKRRGLDVEVFSVPFSANDRSLAMGNETGKVKLLLAGGRPVGVQVLGPRAGELVNYWVAALNVKAKLSVLAGAIHPYPTLAEINKTVAGRVYEGKLYSPVVKKILSVLFGLRGK
ncbi:MAG: FAD-dependent oxidoreductase [Deltaproteobacteria bacterium]|nr:FAD-dependent oxidoreductase [Deltaproteobacteria bacterium]